MTARRRKSNDPKAITGPLKRDGDVYLSPRDLLQLELAQARIESLTAQIAKVDHYVARLRAETEAKCREQLEGKSALAKSLQNSVGDLVALRRRLEAVYKISFEGISYDDETGKLTPSE